MSRWWACSFALAMLGCSSEVDDPAPNPAWRESGVRASAYLVSTESAVPPDGVVAMMVFAERSGDERVLTHGPRRLRLLPDESVMRYGPALGTMHPSFDEVSSMEEPSDVPNPQMEGDDRDQSCPLSALRCELTPACESYLQEELWGYSLTHQALTLVFSLWGGCEEERDRRDARIRLGARLLAEQRSDAVPSDLAAERLAMLAHLGWGASIDAAWCDDMVEAQLPSGAFPWSPMTPQEADTHATGVSLWALGLCLSP